MRKKNLIDSCQYILLNYTGLGGGHTVRAGLLLYWGLVRVKASSIEKKADCEAILNILFWPLPPLSKYYYTVVKSGISLETLQLLYPSSSPSFCRIHCWVELCGVVVVPASNLSTKEGRRRRSRGHCILIEATPQPKITHSLQSSWWPLTTLHSTPSSSSLITPLLCCDNN